MWCVQIAHEIKRGVLVAAVALFGVAGAQAATLQVPTDYATIRDAIGAAVDGDTIELAPGVYFESRIFIDASVPDNLRFRGATGNCSDVVLSGVGQNWIFQYGGGRAGRLENLTFSNAYRGQGEGSGAALSVLTAGHSPRLEIVNCRFVNCRTLDASGGALAWYGFGHLFMRNCVFESNGGGVGAGGAAHLVSVTYDIGECQFLNNLAGAQGGALSFNDESRGTITGCLFQGNFLTSSLGKGGAIWLGPGVADVIDSSFKQNVSDYGPSIAVDHGTFTATNCDFDAAGYISGNAVVTMSCCILGDIGGWNIPPTIASDGCAVATESVTWGEIKSLFR